MKYRKSPVSSRRNTAVVLFLLLALAALALGGCGSSAKTTRVVRVGFLRNDLHQLAYYVAREKGFFKEQGIDVREVGQFNAGPEEMSAFSAGDLDIGYVGAAPAITFAGQDMADVKIVAQANTGGSSIVVRPGVEGNDVAALKGRTVAIPGISTMQDFLLRTALKKANVDPADVNIIVVKPPEMLQALASAQIDAAVAWEPYPSMAVAQNAGWVLMTSQKIWPDHPCCMVVADSRFIKANPDTVRRFVAAHVKATKYIRDNKLEAVDLAHLYTGQDPTVARNAMKNIGFSYLPEAKLLERYVSFMKDAGVIKVTSAPAFTRRLIDTQFIQGGGS